MKNYANKNISFFELVIINLIIYRNFSEKANEHSKMTTGLDVRKMVHLLNQDIYVKLFYKYTQYTLLTYYKNEITL